MTESILRTKTKEFAKNVIFLCREIKQNGAESVLVNQLLRSGTSIGANVHEAQYAQGTKDFISKLEIALKECNESSYWIELLYDTNCLNEEIFNDLQKQCIELRRMLVSSITTLKKK
jgi:four helix bundle protein